MKILTNNGKDDFVFNVAAFSDSLNCRIVFLVIKDDQSFLFEKLPLGNWCQIQGFSLTVDLIDVISKEIELVKEELLKNIQALTEMSAFHFKFLGQPKSIPY